MSATLDDDWSEPRPAARRARSSWLVPGLLALIVFELTADPALTVAVGCLKFGWDALATSRWLKRTDPDRARGRICGRFYAAWALWRVSMVATAMMFILVIAFAQAEPMRKPGAAPAVPPPAFMSACVIAILGFLISAWMSNLAVVSAWRRGVRVWLGPEGPRARKLGVWPPSLATAAHVRENRAATVFLSALLTNLMMLFLVGLIVGLNIAPRIAFHPPPWVVFALVMLAIAGPPVAILTLLDIFKRRIIAASPWECWPPDEAP